MSVARDRHAGWAPFEDLIVEGWPTWSRRLLWAAVDWLAVERPRLSPAQRVDRAHTMTRVAVLRFGRDRRHPQFPFSQDETARLLGVARKTVARAERDLVALDAWFEELDRAVPSPRPISTAGVP